MSNKRFLHAALTSALAILFHTSAPAQSVNQSKPIKVGDSLSKQPGKKEKLSLVPTREDKAAFAEFLKRPQTGMIRLLPRILYRSGLKISGGGPYYSFDCLTYEYGYGSDIELQAPLILVGHVSVPPTIADYSFVTGLAGADYGLIAMLGDAPIEKVTPESDGVRFLADYRPATTGARARAEFERFRGGVINNGHKYARSAPVIVNQTYALRSIIYDRSDVLVAFRVAREESNGSVLILWKMLKRFLSPQLIR